MEHFIRFKLAWSKTQICCSYFDLNHISNCCSWLEMSLYLTYHLAWGIDTRYLLCAFTYKLEISTFLEFLKHFDLALHNISSSLSFWDVIILDFAHKEAIFHVSISTLLLMLFYFAANAEVFLLCLLSNPIQVFI